MTRFQKTILAVLSAVALLILGSLVCIVGLFWVRQSNLEAIPVATVAAVQAAPVVASQPSAAPASTETATATAAATAAATAVATATAPQPALPSPTSTKVVVSTVQPTPTPTRANCENEIYNFEASGVVTNEQVQQYLRQTIPTLHLENCREIRYTPIQAAVHGNPITGSFIPVYREINVYATRGEIQTVDEILDTLIHEIGHNVHYNIRRYDFDLDVKWAELYRQSQDTVRQTGLGFVSNYAQSNKFEDFAESYLAYVRYPDLLLLYNPAKYEFMRDNVFDGREYGN